jgi:hypothetical protein
MMFNIRQARRLQVIVLAMCSGIRASAIASASAGRPLISAMGTKSPLQACAVLSICAAIDEMRLGPIVSFDVDVADAHALVPFGWEFESSIGSLECTAQATALVVWDSLPCTHARTKGSPRLEGAVKAVNDVADAHALVPFGWEIESSIESLECTAQATALVVWDSLPCRHAPTGELPSLGGTVKAVNQVACEQLMLLQLPSPTKVSTSRVLVAASFFVRPPRQQEQGMPQDRLRKALLHLMSIARKLLKLKFMDPESPDRKRFRIVDFLTLEYEWCVVQEAGAGDASTTPCTTDEQLIVLGTLNLLILFLYGSLWVIVQAQRAGHFRFCLGKLCALVLWCSGILRWLGRYLWWLGHYLWPRQRPSGHKLSKVCPPPNVEATLARIKRAKVATARKRRPPPSYPPSLYNQPLIPPVSIHATVEVEVVRTRPIDVAANNDGHSTDSIDVSMIMERVNAAIARRSRTFRWPQSFDLDASEWQEYNQEHNNANEIATVLCVAVFAKYDGNLEIVVLIP